MGNEVTGELWVESVEEFVVVVRDHGRIELVEERVLKVTLGVPRYFKWFSSSNSSGQVRVGNFFDPRFELLVKSP